MRHVALAVVHDRVVATNAPKSHDDERKHGTHDSDDHQDDSDLVDVEAVLIWRNGHRPVENGSDRKGNDAHDESTSSDHDTSFPCTLRCGNTPTQRGSWQTRSQWI